MATNWEKSVARQIAALQKAGTSPELLEAIEVWKQEVAESHALLKQARIALTHAKRIIVKVFTPPTPTETAVLATVTASIDAIPEGL